MLLQTLTLSLALAVPAGSGGSVAQASDSTYYVSTTGSDENIGTIEQPFASLERARDAIRIRKESRERLPEITVFIRGGVYTLDSTFTLEQQDSGRTGARIIYRAYRDEEVRLIGGLILPAREAREPSPEEIFLLRDDEATRQGVRVFHLPALGVTSFGLHKQYGHGQPVIPSTLELFINREAAPLARYPNEGSLKIGSIIDSGSVPRIRDYSNRGAVFEYTDDRHAEWSDVEDVWLQGTFMWGYADDKILVESTDPQTRQVKLATPHMYGVGTGAPYRQYVALNILKELDSPGEWYLDRQSGKLFFWPPDQPETSEIAISLLEDPLFSLVEVSHVTIRGIVLEFGRGMGIYMEGGESNLIAGVTVRNVGTTGILMGMGARQTVAGITHDDYEGQPASGIIGSLIQHRYHHTVWNRNAGRNHRIQSCDVYNTGAGGIFLGGGDRTTLEPGNSTVENCRTWKNQRRNKFLWAGINVDGVGNRVAHNEVFDSDYQGIMAYGNDHVFEYNHVHHIGMDSDDTSPWYMGRDPSGRGNIVRYNYFHDIGRADRMGMGIYMDDGTCGTLVHGNVLENVASYGTVYSNSGSDNTITNNIFLNGFGPALHIKSMWYTWAIRHIPYYWDEGGVYRRRLLEMVDITAPPYSERYPEGTDFMDLMEDGKTYVGMIPKRNVFARNLVVNYEEMLRLDYPNIELDVYDNWQVSGDPGFTSMENRDYRLREDAEVFDRIPGFERVPFEKMGTYSDEYRE